MSGKLEPVLAAEITSLRGGMIGAAEQVPLPARFAAEPCGNKVTITDQNTGRDVVVGLCDYLGARVVLSVLFPDDLPCQEVRNPERRDYGQLRFCYR